MQSSDPLQSQMLDFLYGLLEPQEAQALELRIDSDPDYRLAYQRALAWQQQLAQAARAEFPGVRFVAPAVESSQPKVPIMSGPSASSQPSPRTMSSIAMRWTIAAAVLIGTAGVFIPLSRHYLAVTSQRQEVARLETEVKTKQVELTAALEAERVELALRQQRLSDAQQAWGKVQQDWATAVQKAQQAIQSKSLYVSITGPERIQPGASNEFKIRTLNSKTHNPEPAKVEVVVSDAAGKVLYREPPRPSIEPLTVKLPLDMWKGVAAGTDVLLDVVAHDENGGTSKLCEKVNLAKPVFITHLVTDKPMYQKGETVYFRSLTLDRSSFTPAAEELQLQFRITGPDGGVISEQVGTTSIEATEPGTGLNKPILGPDGKPLRGIGSGAYTIDPGMPGGEYTITVTRLDYSQNVRNRFQFDPRTDVLETRKFLVNEYVADKYNKKLEFDGKSYGPGDTVQAKGEATRSTGQILINTPVDVSVMVDGQQAHKETLTTDAAGAVNVRFALPAKINGTDASLTMTFRGDEGPEAIVRPIPLVTRKLDVEFYPEGGDLVVGLKSRVYFQVRNHKNKPADLKGYLSDGTNKIVDLATLTDADQPGVNRGLGSFEFTPEMGKKYELIIERPLGIEGKFPLPAIKDDGVVLRLPEGVTGPDQAITVQLTTGGGKQRKVMVGAYCRGQLLAHESATLEPGKTTEVLLKSSSPIGGVVRVTVFEEKAVEEGKTTSVPVAERLVFRRSGQKVNVQVTPNKSRYTPGEKGVELTLRTTNEKGEAIPAVALVSVVNQSILTMADDKTERLMPTHLLLASEVKNSEDLEHADFLVGEHPKAALTLDLLLGTQGWRRFAEVSPADFQKREPQLADRLFASNGMKSKAPVETLYLEEQRINHEYRVLADRADLERQSAIQKVNEPAAQGPLGSEVVSLGMASQNLQNQLAMTRNQLTGSVAQLREVQAMTLPALCLGLAALALVMVFYATRGGAKNPVPYYAMTGTAVVACASIMGFLALNSGIFNEVRFDRDNDIVAMATGVAPQDADLALMADGVAVQNVDAPRAEMAAPVGGAQFDDQRKGGIPLPLAAPAGPEPMAGEAGPRRFAMQPKMEALGEEKKEKLLRQFDRKDLQGEQRGAMAANGMPAPAGKRAPFAPGAAMPQPGQPGIPGPAGDFDFRRQNRAKEQAFGQGQGLGERELQADRKADKRAERDQMPIAAAFVVREYAHMKGEDAGNVGLRTDFTETLLWKPALVIGDTGEAKVNFALGDDITRYRVLVAVHTLDGRVGATTMHIESRQPFSLDPKLPIEVTAGDKLDVAVRLTNDSDEPRSIIYRFLPKGLKLESGPATSSTAALDNGGWMDRVKLSPDERTRRLYRFIPDMREGIASLRIDGESDPQASPDRIERTVRVVAEGFPSEGAVSDMLEKTAIIDLPVPELFVKGSMKVDVSLYPSTMADLQKGLEGLLREPNGCFEQTSTSNYPNLLILDYLESSDQANPEVSKRAKDLLDRGYQKLTSFECVIPDGSGRRGYEWFGGNAMPHEALTAYGLLQFRDMARVYPVDMKMIERTQAYLLSCRDGKGSFSRNARALDNFGGAPQHLTDVYIVWALTESDPGNKQKLDLDKEFAALLAKAKDTKDPYFLSLLANALINRDQLDTAVELLQKVKDQQTKEGLISGAETSITRSGGRDLEIETTAFAVMAMLKANRPDVFEVTLQNAVKWIGQQRGGYGGYGSTQSTILALKALIKYTQAKKAPGEDGELIAYIGDTKVGEIKFTAKSTEPLALAIPDIEKHVQAGKNLSVRLTLSTKKAYPFTVGYNCMTLKPNNSGKELVKLATRLSKTEATEGEAVQLNVEVANQSGKGQGMVTAIVGIPAGLKVPEDMKQLKQLCELPNDGSAPQLSFFEIRGRELVLYWRQIQPDQKLQVSIDLICNLPGEYRGPASRGYLYYNADDKHWVDPLSIAIAPAKAE